MEGESGAKGNRGELQQKEYLNEVKRLRFITHNVAVQLDETPFHLNPIQYSLF